jgi:hypothetical protein
LQQLRAGNSNSSFVRVEPTLATGPTRKAAKSMTLPQSKASYFLSQYADIVICHQIMNPLNYLYLGLEDYYFIDTKPIRFIEAWV